MIELTDSQIEALDGTAAGPPQAVNPHTHETYILVPLDEYRRLTGMAYDADGWSRDELHAQAWEAGRSLGWEGMDEYDALPVRP